MFRKLLRNGLLASSVGLFTLGAAALVVVPVIPAMAQPARPFSPRVFPDQQTAYWRFSINFNSCVYAALTCSVRVGALPYNAFLVRGYQQVTTTFSGGGITAFTVALGTAPATANIVAAQSALTAGNGAALTMAAIGVGVTGNGIAQSGAQGGFDLWATLTATTGAPTAGSAQYVIEFIAPNDGSCAPVPSGATAPAC